MKKTITLPSKIYEEADVVFLCKEILENFRVDGLIGADLDVYDKKNVKNSVETYFGNEVNGFIHTYKRHTVFQKSYNNVEKPVTYEIEDTYEIYGLKQKTKVTFYHKSIKDAWKESEASFEVEVKGKKDLCEDVEKMILDFFKVKA